MTTDIAVRGHADFGDPSALNAEEEYDENSSARLFERSRIQALASQFLRPFCFAYSISISGSFCVTLNASSYPRLAPLPCFFF